MAYPREAELKAETLKEAFPYLREFRGQTVVVKYGGNVSPAMLSAIAEDVAILKHIGINPVVVHGGGPQISRALDEAGVSSRREEGERLTSREAMPIVKRELEKMNREIVSLINRHGASAKAMHGYGKGLLVARSAHGPGEGERTGKIVKVNAAVLRRALRDRVPVVSPIGVDGKGNHYNINADTAAAAIAVALGAKKLTILTNVDGVMEGEKLHSTLTVDEALEKIRKGVIQSGMIPKVRACIEAVKGKVGKAHLLNGERPHALLLEIFTKKGAGTEIVRA
ncbi:MAG: acetylglutamate kinase [Candidatus Micrarchaeota archaeon]|nr:acetylglutamate kinase [Candidatus Micrarchaeota archaeon]